MLAYPLNERRVLHRTLWGLAVDHKLLREARQHVPERLSLKRAIREHHFSARKSRTIHDCPGIVCLSRVYYVGSSYRRANVIVWKFGYRRCAVGELWYRLLTPKCHESSGDAHILRDAILI